MQEDYSIFPERQIKYAGFWARFAAWFLDQLILSPVSIIITYFTTGSYFVTGYQDGFSYFFSSEYMLIQFLATVTGWLYFSLLESGAAQATLGKRALGLKVTSLHGERISFGRATGRYFAKWISGIILLIGYIMAAFDSRKQALHDKIVATLVIQAENQ